MAEAIRETGVEPSCIELEITESVLIKYSEDTFDKLRKLKQLGLKVTIDDFGTGYSSLSYLQHLQADYLKIDRSFVNEPGESPEGDVLLAAIINLARSLGMGTIAEGVETEAQLSRLRELECDIAQGYYLARPQPADEVSKLLTEDYGPARR